MPIYEYECDKCGGIEILHPMNDVKDKCPQCGSKLKKLVSTCGGFILSGSGFYSNDYSRTRATIGNAEKPGKGQVFFNDAFPDQARIVEKMNKRRVDGKPIDGACFKEAGMAKREADDKCISSVLRHNDRTLKEKLGV